MKFSQDFLFLSQNIGTLLVEIELMKSNMMCFSLQYYSLRHGIFGSGSYLSVIADLDPTCQVISVPDKDPNRYKVSDPAGSGSATLAILATSATQDDKQQSL